MRLQTTAKLKKILYDAGIATVEELMFADLRSCGWDKSDAFYVAFRDVCGGMTIQEQRSYMKQLETKDNIQRRIGKLENRDKDISPSEVSKETSKEKILSDLLKARKKTNEGTKEWIDLTKAIADYAKIKQDDIKTNDEPIKYYLPVHYPTSCKDCLVWMNKNRAENLDGKK